jgi:hypothetical protein
LGRAFVRVDTFAYSGSYSDADSDVDSCVYSSADSSVVSGEGVIAVAGVVASAVVSVGLVSGCNSPT